ncbi:hypothetical protein LV84_00717 [Algoriphagus ratkowskyi]|uniref:DUF4177 domain-containing protein n=2 Tax=Algoriphagus ratkowskyi TaxID=57028 RepID=A0A2W7RHQ8_9BACT|nr:hypothetical protein LV84_00717 [Algoriphagus ratkowskyi]
MLFVFPFLIALVCSTAQAQTNSQKSEFKIITIIESVMPNDRGESRIIDSETVVDSVAYATYKTDGSKSRNKEIEREKLRLEKLDQIKLLELYDGIDVSFRNVASNDAMITSKINSMLKEGWSLTFVTTAIESDAGNDDYNGIVITRLFFSK